MELTGETYFSKEAEEYYTGSTQIKNFLECEAKALATIKGEWVEEPSKAQLVSSYIDSVISDEVEQFKEKNPDIFLKNGELKADYRLADEVIDQIKNDTMFMKYLQGEHQIITTGEIAGVPVKIKMDSYFFNKCIVDLKCIANMDLIWNEKTHQKENFIDYYNYVLQAALYQEIVRQNTGLKLPFIIAVATKEKYSERALLNIPQKKMDEELEKVKEYLPRIQAIKQGKIIPTYCGHCDYCKSLTKVTNIYNYNDYFEKRGGI